MTSWSSPKNHHDSVSTIGKHKCCFYTEYYKKQDVYPNVMFMKVWKFMQIKTIQVYVNDAKGNKVFPIQQPTKLENSLQLKWNE